MRTVHTRRINFFRSSGLQRARLDYMVFASLFFLTQSSKDKISGWMPLSAAMSTCR